MPNADTTTMRAVRFHNHGEPTDVLRLDEVAISTPSADQVRVRVTACGLTPADTALCRGLFASDLPCGIGLEVSGNVDAVGERVLNVSIGDPVFGVPDFAAYPSAGVADFAVLAHWAAIPDGLDPLQAAALPMAVETASRSLDVLGVAANQTFLINGAGTTVGFAAVQIALMRGARVIATSGDTFADRLRDLGATVTSYGDGVVARVREIAGGVVDLALDTAPAGGALPDLVKIVDDDPDRVLTISDFGEADKLGVRTTGREQNIAYRYDVLDEFAQLAAQGKFSVPVADTFAMEDWREAFEVSLSGRARGKLLILPHQPAARKNLSFLKGRPSDYPARRPPTSFQPSVATA